MTDNASRRGAADLGMPLMVVAFLVIGGFMYWLYGEAQAENALQIVEEETPDVIDDIAGAVTIAAVDIQLDATPYEGQVIRLAGLNVASLVGTQGFWLEMPNGNPFLVSMSDEIMAEGIVVAMGSEATVVGTVVPMTPEIPQAWLDAGTIGDGDKLAAEFATHYMDAQLIVVDGVQAGGAGEAAEGDMEGEEGGNEEGGEEGSGN